MPSNSIISHLKCPTLILIGLYMLGCPEPPPTIADCDPGYLPCEDDQSECCEVICDEGYHLCGEDSTECCIDKAECPPGQLPCESDSTICCDIECPPGFVIGGVDSTECVPIECLPGYYICGEDSNECCPEITSHDFTWTVEVLGTWQGELKDVAIINENDIWVVGQIKFGQSGFEDSTYNAAHWDGNEWIPVQIPIPSLGTGGTIVGYHPYMIRTVLSFSNDNVWFSPGGPIMVHWDGTEYQSYVDDYEVIQDNCVEMWGLNSTNIYRVGYEGTIVKFNGSEFIPMTSPTTVDLRDVWGDPSGEHVYACGYGATLPSVLLKLKNGTWNIAYQANDQDWSTDTIWAFNSRVWTDDPNKIYVASGNGIWECPKNTQGQGIYNNGGFSTPTYGFRGQTQGDLIRVGQLGEVQHYNGQTWYEYGELANDTDFLLNVDIYWNSAVIVGMRYVNGIERYALVIKGTR